MLIGVEVPAIGKEGMEVLRDSNDAKDWQEAVKALLSDEIRARADAKFDERVGSLQTIHNSIDLFQNNKDMVPGTAEFDKELADNVMKFARPYMERDDKGKLLGFSIPIQPLVDQERQVLEDKRKAKPAAPAAQAAPGSTQKAAPAQRQAAPPHTPQAGIRSKAGQSGEDADDFSTLFGTIGLPNLRI